MPQSGVPTAPPTTTEFDYGAQVKKAWGDSWHQREVAYEWSNGRKFYDSGARNGIYAGTST